MLGEDGDVFGWHVDVWVIEAGLRGEAERDGFLFELDRVTSFAV